jgi:hypothetical protein
MDPRTCSLAMAYDVKLHRYTGVACLMQFASCQFGVCCIALYQLRYVIIALMEMKDADFPCSFRLLMNLTRFEAFLTRDVVTKYVRLAPVMCFYSSTAVTFPLTGEECRFSRCGYAPPNISLCSPVSRQRQRLANALPRFGPSLPIPSPPHRRP